MDYMYGKLNQVAQKVTYTGNESSTIITEVDNVRNVISAQIKQIPLNLLQVPAEDGTYTLKVTVESGNVVIGWEPIE